MVLWLGVLQSAWAQTCTVLVDGEPGSRLDCVAAEEWTVRCSIPANVVGKLRARIWVPDRGIEAEARLPLGSSDMREHVFAVAGPSGRAGEFLVSRAGNGLLPGQAVGPMQLCPVVQPGVKPGSDRAEVALKVRLTAHQQTGFAEETLDGGLVNRVPVYDKGRVVAAGDARIVQLPVRDVPIFAGSLPMLRDEAVTGTLKVRGAAGWEEVSWSGWLRDLPVDTGEVSVLAVDFEEAELARATGEAPVDFLTHDLVRWMEGGYDTLFGAAAWSRSGLRVPVRGIPAFEAGPRGMRWARAGAIEIRVIPKGRSVRVLVAHRAAPFDDATRAVVGGAAEQP